MSPTLSLLLVLGGVLLPYLLRLPPWLALLMAGLLGWRALIALRGWPQPGVLILAGLAVLIAGGAVNTFETVLGRDGGTAFLLGLMTLKLLEARTPRDARLMVLLGYFAVTANFFFSQDIGTALYTAAALLALTGLLGLWSPVRLARSSAAPDLRAPLRSSALALWGTLGRTARLMVGAVPLAALLFVLFPRPAGPLWTMPIQSSAASTGLSDEMSPGSIDALAKRAGVVFRVEFQGTPPTELYWRGPVLERYDGQTWRQGPLDLRPPLLEARGPTVAYTLTLEPTDKPWVLALDAPAVLPPRTRLSSRLQVLAQPQAGRRRFSLEALAQYYAGRQEYPERLDAARLLPSVGNPRARALAASWAALPPLERVNRALALLGGGGFVYTLSPPLLPVQDGIDALLYDTRAGFCEHYAGAFTFLMRASGVPARVVTGYLGLERSLDGSYGIVRQSLAHAWSEVWLEGVGWRRVDPTTAVSPARLTDGVAGSVANPGALSPLARTGEGWLHGLSLRLDALQAGWNGWVVGYDGARQRELLRLLGLGEVGSPGYTLALLVAGGLGLLLLGQAVRRARSLPSDPVQRAWLELALRLGDAPRPAETARAFARRMALERPAQAQELRGLAEQHDTLRYGEQATPEQVRAFRRRVRAFRRRSS